MDNPFKSGSIRAKIYLLALFVFIFFIVGALQHYLDRIVYRAEGTYFKVVKLGKTFSKILSGENAALHAPSVDDLLQEYQDVRGSCRECHSQATESLIAVRQRLFARLYQLNKDILALNTDIHSRLIDLLGSVNTSIHIISHT
jgi:hypothetical protein